MPQVSNQLVSSNSTVCHKPACGDFQLTLSLDPEKSRDFIMSLLDNPPPVESEDCLYLNVYAPSRVHKLKPVMVWIFGGDFQFGTASLSAYNGSSFARDQDVVVVSFNYRTNGKQNLGFLDQRYALQWVQENIKAFGGDPSQVTIFGESAGGYSVKQLLANPPTPVPFRAAIMESEGANTGPSSYQELLVLTNCTAAASKLECLRQLPATTLKSIIERNELAFPPIFDGVTAVQTTGPAFQSGKAAKVPFLMGTNANEGTAFAYPVLLINPNTTVEGYLEYVGIPAAYAKSIAAAYPYNTTYQALSAILTDLQFHCPAALLAETASAAGYHVWRYFYDAVFANEQAYPGAGAYHSSEIPEVFGTYLANSTAGQIGLSRYMQKAWADFAKHPGSIPWPQVSEGKLGKLIPRSPYETTIPTSQIDAQCKLLDPLIRYIGY